MIKNTFDMGFVGGTRMRAFRNSLDSSLSSSSTGRSGDVLDNTGRGRSGVGVHLTHSK
jgi:hypothetical protein